MDPLTHALVGAAASRVALGRPLGGAAWLPGVVGALLPDVDALIRSEADPLLYAEFHRHFTHALAFVPLGGMMAAAPWLVSRASRRRWTAYLGAATAGYATHGVLDACTTYGTLLLWPFSYERVAWNVVSIIDPVFTAVALAGVVTGAWRRQALPALVSLALCVAYLGAGAVQRERAKRAQADVAASRGHLPERGAVFPAAGTNIVWRSMYEVDGRFFMDRLRVPPFRAAAWSPGYVMDRKRGRDLPRQADARVRRDFERFEWFAGGWVAQVPGEPDMAGDARYSASAARFEPVWAIRYRPGSPRWRVDWIDRSRRRRVSPAAMWAEIRGTDPTYRPVPRTESAE